jgi:hypothetical protein
MARTNRVFPVPGGHFILAGALRRRVHISKEVERPQDSNFIGWTGVLMNQLCPRAKNTSLRSFFHMAPCFSTIARDFTLPVERI